MNAKPATSTPDDDGRPFGSRPGRSWMPVYFWGVLYLVWFGVLLWMAIAHVGK